MNRILKTSNVVFILIFTVTWFLNNTSLIKIDAAYSKLYLKWYNFLSYFAVEIPFSFGDIIYILFPLYIIIRFFKKERRRDRIFFTIKIYMIIYCLFYWSWGFNYNKISNLDYLKKNDYSNDQINTTLKFYIDMANKTQNEITNNKDIKVITSLDFSKIKSECIKSIKQQKLILKNIDLFPVKKSVFSTPLSYMGFSGYINPFTLESNINYNLPIISLPVTITHEMAHQIGYAFEDEANFISINTLINSDNKFLKYSGFIMGMQYLLAEQKKIDSINYEINIKKLNSGVIKNLQEKRDYYLKYENKYEDLFKKSYDKFLKNNNQKAGIKTYSLVVKMLINQHYQ